jgi:hypothetical protein
MKRGFVYQRQHHRLRVLYYDAIGGPWTPHVPLTHYNRCTYTYFTQLRKWYGQGERELPKDGGADDEDQVCNMDTSTLLARTALLVSTNEKQFSNVGLYTVITHKLQSGTGIETDWIQDGAQTNVTER